MTVHTVTYKGKDCVVEGTYIERDPERIDGKLDFAEIDSVVLEGKELISELGVEELEEIQEQFLVACRVDAEADYEAATFGLDDDELND